MKQGSEQMIKEVNLVDYLYVMIKWRTLILRFVLLVFVITTILYFFVIPRWYLSESIITPAKQKTTLDPTSFLKNSLPISGLGNVFKNSDELDLYLTILKSRNCYTRVISKFNLQKVYQLSDIEKTIKELQDNVSFTINDDENALAISVYDTDSSRSAAMANYFVDVLNDIYVDMSISEAKNNFEFMKKRYIDNQNDLKRAEDSLSEFQHRYGIFEPKEQIKVTIEAAATLESKLILKKVELGVLHESVGSENRQYLNTKIEIAELQKSLDQMNNGTHNETEYFKIFPFFKNTPVLAKHYFRLFREVELQSKLEEFLLPMVEQARIQQQKDIPVVVVLDKAVPALKPKKPKRALMILLFTVLSIILATATVFFIDALERLKGDIQSQNDIKWKYVISRLSFKSLLRIKGSLKDE